MTCITETVICATSKIQILCLHTYKHVSDLVNTMQVLVNAWIWDCYVIVPAYRLHIFVTLGAA